MNYCLLIVILLMFKIVSATNAKNNEVEMEQDNIGKSNILAQDSDRKVHYKGERIKFFDENNGKR